MNSQVFSSSSLFIFLFLVGIPLSLSNVNEILYESCATLFKCGTITDVDYPFWGGDRPRGCGYPGLELKCDKGVATIEFMSVKYRVLDIKPNDQVLKIARADFLDKGICVSQFYNTTLDTTPFDYALGYEMKLTFFYGCPPSALFIPSKFSCPIKGVTYNDGYVVPEIFGALRPEGCHYSVDVPVLQKNLVDFGNSFSLLDEVFGEGFDVRWKVDSRTCIECQKTNGRCGSNYSSNQFTCICPNQKFGSQRCTTSPADRSAAPQAAPPPPGSSSGINISKKIAIGISGSVAGIIIIFIVMISSLKPDCLSGKAMNFWKKETKNEQKVEAFIRSYGSLAPNRYNFSDVKKMTKSFADKLGQGGYGGVYKGKLSDGHLVAVKVLSKSKGNGEEFINEVASISRTSHVNIVTLLGFCYERTKRALIYEFMPNGSLDKFIYDEGSSNTNRHLEWKTLYQIAVGIARGLEYLHRGCNTCNTRILHFDIKPHNVLLDEDFCPKISDFGLAKLCLRKESIISMQGTRGTAGYIAPELFSRNFGGVSHKSDVYSYGMMVLEMVGGRKNIDVGGSRTSEIYFPHWIHKNLELGEDLKLKGVMTEEEEETARKMILVGLWCIQTNPSNRPSISRAVEMLEGSLQSLQIPPKPFLSSPTRSPQHSSKTSSL